MEQLNGPKHPHPRQGGTRARKTRTAANNAAGFHRLRQHLTRNLIGDSGCGTR
jgi:hypothetical protein